MTSKKNILVAPLNWGLGHATRCIPIINQLQEQGFNPIIASDGKALEILQKEFPNLKSIVLPSYNIQYPKKGKWLKWKLLFLTPQIIKATKSEYKIVQKLVKSENLSGIISDNRFGVRSDKVPSVFITHQLNVLSGATTFFTSKLHQNIINKFDECWIPDDEKLNYSGKLSQSNSIKKQKHIGVLSRFKKIDLPIIYDLLVLLSGVEPSRNQLEEKLLSELKTYKGSVLFVRGKVKNQQKKVVKNNITTYNFLLTDELQTAINQSKLVLARSGYSTIMDLATLGKKSFFIPTTGQNEQEYLATYLQNLKIAPFATQENFKVEMLEEVENYLGFKNSQNTTQIDFNLF
ncbi:MAG: glycosyltransferase [Flavobacteriaceae bacterium]|nr:MAG: glycosyltransferase [Flavobacteriaceae bacterium]